MPASARDKSISHFHVDPKLIKQIGASSTLSIGQLVYLDTDGLYKPALAVSEQMSNIQGIVWSFVGADSFYLKSEPSQLSYRLPFTKDYFNTFPNGKVNPVSINNTKIPGDLGAKVYLSETVPGGLQSTPATNLNYNVIIIIRLKFFVKFSFE